MKTNRLIVLVLAALLLIVLLILRFSPREGGRYGESPPAPAVPVVLPVKPAVTGGVKKKEIVKRRAKRDSKLRNPGEAFIGGASTGPAPAPKK